MRPRLIVLSSCESGAIVGRDRSDELIALPGTLLAAGATAVIATHWEVGDLESSFRIGEFFRSWKGGEIPAATALAEAQRRVRSEITSSEVARVVREWSDAKPDDPILRAAASAWEERASGAPAFPSLTQWAPFYLVGLP